MVSPGSSPASRVEARPRISAFWWAALATVLVRSLVAASRLDELELELYSGSLAWSLVQGLPLDPHQLPVIPHNRGSVVFGGLLAPAFWVFGPQLWVIKALAISLSAITAGLLAWLAERHISPRAGLAAALLLALLPPTYQMVDVLALASHGDSVLFTALALALLLAIPSGEGDEPMSLGHGLTLGVVLGFGIFFSLQCLVALPALIVVWWLRDRSFWKRPATGAALVAGALWLLPARAMLGVEDGGVIVNQSASERFLPDGPLGALLKWGQTFTTELPAAWAFEQHGGALARWVLLAALAVGLVLVLRRALELQPLAVFCLLYPALVAAAYAVSNFQLKVDDTLDGMGSRYLMPMQPFMALWIPFGFAAAGPPQLARLARFATGAAALAGLVGWYALLDPGLALRQPPVRGTELAFFHGHVERAGGDDLAARAAWIERVEPDWPEWRPLVHRAVQLPASARASDDPGTLLGAIREQAADVQPFLWVSLGREQAERLERLAVLPLEPSERRWVLRGAGAQLLMRYIARISRPRGARGKSMFAELGELTRSLDPAEREALIEGLGFQLGLRLTVYQPILLGVLGDTQSLSDGLAASFYRALGEGYRHRFLESRWRTPGELSIEALLPERARAPFRAGLLSIDHQEPR